MRRLLLSDRLAPARAGAPLLRALARLLSTDPSGAELDAALAVAGATDVGEQGPPPNWRTVDRSPRRLPGLTEDATARLGFGLMLVAVMVGTAVTNVIGFVGAQ